MFHTLDNPTDFFDSVTEVLSGDLLAPFLLIICLDYFLRISIDPMKENKWSHNKKKSSSTQHLVDAIKDADYADDLKLLANT